jgi:threonine synthase
MSFARQIVCARCGKCFELSALLNLCPCGSPVLVRYDLAKAKTAFDQSSLSGRVSSLWRYRELLQNIRASHGTALSVRDDEMLAEIPRVAKVEGIFFCPEGAACVAALRRLMASGWIKSDNEVVIFNTASGLKYLDVIQG